MYKKKAIGLFIAAILAISVFAAMPVTAQGSKTLYVISDMGQGTGTTTLEAYALDATGTVLTLAGTYNLPYTALGAVGMALDDVNDKLFVTYEASGTILVFDATNFNQIGNIATPGNNLAGIVVDTATNTIYVVDRGRSTIYMYDSATHASKGTGDISPVGAWGLAFDSTNNHLYVTDTSSIVSVFDPSGGPGVFPLAATYDTGHTAVGIAVDFSDPNNVIIYTADTGGSGLGDELRKYNTTDGTIMNVTGLTGPTGVTVDPDTQMVYITDGTGTGTFIGEIQVYDTATMSLQNNVTLPSGWYPTDLVIGEVEFEPEPVPVPQLTPIGLLALFGILAMLLVSWTVVKRK